MTFKQEATEQFASLNQKAVETSDLQTRSNWTTCLTQSKGCWNKWPSNKKQLNNLPHSIKRLVKQVTFKQEAIEQLASLNQKAVATCDLQTRSNWTTCLTQSKDCWNKWPSNKKQLNNLPHSIKRLMKQVTFKQEAIEQLASLKQKAVETSDFQTRSNWTTCLTQSKGCWNKRTSNKRQFINLLHSIKRLLKQENFKQEAIHQSSPLNQKTVETRELQTRGNSSIFFTQSKHCWNKRTSNKRQFINLLHSIKRLLKQENFKQEAIHQSSSLNQKFVETSGIQLRDSRTTR